MKIYSIVGNEFDEPAEIIASFYSKEAAKNFIKYELDLKVNNYDSVEVIESNLIDDVPIENPKIIITCSMIFYVYSTRKTSTKYNNFCDINYWCKESELPEPDEETTLTRAEVLHNLVLVRIADERKISKEDFQLQVIEEAKKKTDEIIKMFESGKSYEEIKNLI